MREIIMIVAIAVALSMDTFSAALSLGVLNIRLKKGIILSSIIGVMHFIMPLLGMLLGKIVLNILPFEPDFFLGIIFLILTFKTSYDLFIEKKDNIDLSIIGILIFSFSVSFDAFTTGIGLLAITSRILLSTTIFMITSYLFTLLGILIGKYVSQKIGRLSAIFGIIILITMALYLII